MERYYKKWFKVLALPAILLFTFVILIPFIMGVLYAFTGWKGTYFTGGENWWNSLVGFKNFARVFRSKKFLSALLYTVQYTVLSVIVVNTVSLLLSMMISKVSKGKGFFRSLFFFPNLLGGLALGFIWSFIFQNIFSDTFFGANGFLPIEALCNMTQSPTKALFAFVIMGTWQMAGYMTIIYLTGLSNIPKDLYEAAQIDGAGAWKRFKTITIPMLMPSFTIVLFMTLSNGFKMLDANVALTNGDFGTRMLALQILSTTKDTQPPDYGFAQAQAVIFFLIIAVVSLVQVSITKKKEVEA